jgi:EmrB/QacA subfamily drug resistance transporter
MTSLYAPSTLESCFQYLDICPFKPQSKINTPYKKIKQELMPNRSAHHHASKFTSRQRTIALIVVALAFVMDLLDTTIVNIAIPSIQDNLGASYAMIQWIIAGYSLAFATLLITGGRMGDVFGYKRLFMIGVSGFTIASLLCGLAWNPEILVGARIVQGIMAALMVPQVMSMMQIMYKPAERAGVMGIFGALAGIAASLGPVIGGILIHFNLWNLDWRPVFLINIPVGVFALFMGWRYLPDGKSAHPLKLDITGTILVVGAMLLLVFPLIQGRELDWPLWVFIMMTTAAPMLALFGWWLLHKNKKDKSPLIPPVLLKTRSFVVGLLVNIIFQAAMAGFFLPFTLLLQIGLGYEVIKAALTGIPIAIGISITIAVLGQKLIPKLGRYAMTLGTVVMATGLWTIYFFVSRSQLDTTPWEFIPGLLLTGIGMGLVMSPLFAVALNDVNHKHAGAASGVLNAVQQLGGAIGVALIGVFFFGQLSNHAASSFDSTAATIRQDLTAAHVPLQMHEQIISGAKDCFVDRNAEKDSSIIPESCKKLQPSTEQQAAILPAQLIIQKQIGETIAENVKKANTDNFTSGFKIALIYQMSLLGLVFALSFLLPRHIRPEALQQAH